MFLLARRNIKCFTSSFVSGSHSNSCTLARPWVYRRCLYIVARCMGKLALSAAWPETRTAPGTAPSAPDTFLPPRGENTHTHSVTLTYSKQITGLYLSSEGLLSLRASSQLLPAFVSIRSHTVSHLGAISTPATSSAAS